MSSPNYNASIAYDLNERSVLSYKKEVGSHSVYSSEQEFDQCSKITMAQRDLMGELTAIPGILTNLSNKKPTNSRYDRENLVIGFNSIEALKRFKDIKRAKDHLKNLVHLFVVKSKKLDLNNVDYKETKGQIRRALFEYRLHPNLHRYYIDKCSELNKHLKNLCQVFTEKSLAEGLDVITIQLLIDNRLHKLKEKSVPKLLSSNGIEHQYAHFTDAITEMEKTLHAPADDIINALNAVPKYEKRIAYEVGVFASHNYKLVMDYAYPQRNRGLDYLDLIQEGNIGLFRAIERFDPHKGHRFSTYGVPWIKQSIQRAIEDTGKLLRIPVNLQEKHQKALTVQKELQVAGVKKDINQIAIDLGYSDGVRERLKEIPVHINSISTPIAEDLELGDTLIDESICIDSSVEDNWVNNKLESALSVLTDRQRLALLMYFGILNYKKRDVEEIADHFKVGKIRAHQIIKEAINILKENSQNLFELWNESILS